MKLLATEFKIEPVTQSARDEIGEVEMTTRFDLVQKDDNDNVIYNIQIDVIRFGAV